MSVYQIPSTLKYRFCLCSSPSFLQQPGLPFSSVLSEERIEQVFREADASFADDEQDSVYTPEITLRAFLSQVLFKAEQRSCLAAVWRVAVFLVALGEKACSKNTGAIVGRGPRFPRQSSVSWRSSPHLPPEKDLPEEYLWLGRHAEAGRRLHGQHAGHGPESGGDPQAATQKPGLGVSAGALRGAVLAGHRHGARSGDRTVFGKANRRDGALPGKTMAGLESGDIIVGDCYFCSYFMICLLRN